jgi:hypothetical protein
MTRLLFSAAVALALVATLTTGCNRRGYRIDGGAAQAAQMPLVGADEDTIAARARPRPVLKALPADILDAEAVRVTVVAHRASSEPGLRELLLARSDGRRVGVLYTPPGGYALPVAVDESLDVQLVPPDSEATFRGVSLVVRAPDGRLIAAIASGGGLPTGALGGEVEMGASGRLVYSDARQLPSLCTVATLHYRLRVRENETFRYVPPGTESRLALDERLYRLISLEVSRPADGRCGDEVAPELSFAVLALPEDSGGARGQGAVQEQPAPLLGP